MMQHTAGGSARSKLGGCIIDILDSPDIRSSSTTSHHHHSHMDCVGPGQTRTRQDWRRGECSAVVITQSSQSDRQTGFYTPGLVDTTGMTGLPLHQHQQSLCHSVLYKCPHFLLFPSLVMENISHGGWWVPFGIDVLDNWFMPYSVLCVCFVMFTNQYYLK